MAKEPRNANFSESEMNILSEYKNNRKVLEVSFEKQKVTWEKNMDIWKGIDFYHVLQKLKEIDLGDVVQNNTDI